jgi:cytochrome c553
MASVVSGLPETVAAEAARFYAARPASEIPTAATDGSDGDRERGRAIALHGVPARDVPPCVECHGPSAMPKNPAYPRLSGQYAEYLALQLTLLQSRRRGGSEYVHLMHSFVDRLTPGDIEDTAAFFAGLDPGALQF